jgi:hypothetical protein
VIEEGRIDAEGTPAALLAESRIQEAYLGMRAATAESSSDEASSESAPDGTSRVG